MNHEQDINESESSETPQIEMENGDRAQKLKD